MMSVLVTVTLIGSIVATTLSQQQGFAFGFVERQQIGEFGLLTAKFGKAVTDALPPGVPGNAVSEFRQLFAQFQKDVINAAVFGDFNQISEIVSRQGASLQGALSRLNEGFGPLDLPDVNAYNQEVLRIFCRTCI